jgi:tRNA pseudouridine38-40 synthase
LSLGRRGVLRRRRSGALLPRPRLEGTLDPSQRTAGGVPCLRLCVKGDSFMLHQIRNMIGAAVAVARGIMPADLLAVALSAPGRVPVPRAPPHTLMLSDNE